MIGSPVRLVVLPELPPENRLFRVLRPDQVILVSVREDCFAKPRATSDSSKKKPGNSRVFLTGPRELLELIA